MSLTPIGDSLRARFGGRISTHALGTADDPAGCEAWHSYCAYSAGAAEALRSLAAELDGCAAITRTLRGSAFAIGAFSQAAEMAREAAAGGPGAISSPSPVERDAGTVLSDPGAADTCMEAGPE